ncbi:glycosyltransferase family 2 protein [Alteromonas sp. C1M14]|uniref:glycosyltransferase family 2 protein n=1 Tax=Alteromonas sp. C1M14 TaxID=2841567 RepID=UPI001C08F61F|nr:glycosyltransferase family 2 protein [Alteromonas sp. C1M14]MBU2977232.1 glycosyltransferase family 2 protein [Alteromonas sp. C1M14]
MTSDSLPTVKLIAIAKDEAAYLPDWIFHHLIAGFCSIDIYVNNTTDNTWEIAKKLAELKNVNFIDADEMFLKHLPNPQDGIYREAIDKAVVEEYSHAMFLDIDEFWVDVDGKTISERIEVFPTNAVVGFGWFVKTNEKPFSRPFEDGIEGFNGAWVKSCFPLSFEIDRVDVHSVKIKDAQYFYADGEERSLPYYAGGIEGAARYTAVQQKQPVKSSFVLHRMFRSQLEYVSLLSRQNPNDLNSKNVSFKNNRNGYLKKFKQQTKVILTDQYTKNWQEEFDAFNNKYSLGDEREKAIRFIKQRYLQVINAINSASYKDVFILDNLLTGVTDEAVLGPYKKLKKKFYKRALVYRQRTRQLEALEVLKTIQSKLGSSTQGLNLEVTRLVSRAGLLKDKILYIHNRIRVIMFHRKDGTYEPISMTTKERSEVINYVLKNLSKVESYSPSIAYELMLIIKKLRPGGIYINRAICTLKRRLEESNND